MKNIQTIAEALSGTLSLEQLQILKKKDPELHKQSLRAGIKKADENRKRGKLI